MRFVPLTVCLLLSTSTFAGSLGVETVTLSEAQLGHNPVVSGILATPDNKKFIIGTGDGSVEILDANTLNVITKLEGAEHQDPDKCFKNKCHVQSMSLSADGSTLFVGRTAFRDAWGEFWRLDLASPKQIMLVPHNNGVKLNPTGTRGCVSSIS